MSSDSIIPTIMVVIGIAAVGFVMFVVGTSIMGLNENITERDAKIAADPEGYNLPHETGIENLTRTYDATTTTFVYVPRGDETSITLTPTDPAIAPLHVDAPRAPVTYQIPLDYEEVIQNWYWDGDKPVPQVQVTIIRPSGASMTVVGCR